MQLTRSVFAIFQLALIPLLAGSEPGPQLEPKPVPQVADPLAGPTARDFSFGYWLNGMRKDKADASPDVLCFETGHYGFSIDMADLPNARFGRFQDTLTYAEALKQGVERMRAVPEAELSIELESKGTVFRAVASKAGDPDLENRLAYTRLWESGRYVQRYDLLGLKFENEDGRPLGVRGSLDIVAWPESLSFTAEIAPSLLYEDGWTQGVVDKALCVIKEPWMVPHDSRLESESMTVEAWVKIPKELESGKWGYLLAKNHHEGIEGHYSFTYKHGRVSANMNFATGRSELQTIPQKGKSFEIGAWNHLAMTYDGDEFLFYINGKQQGRKTVSKSRPFGEGPLGLGQRQKGHGPLVPALFDEVRVWNRALTLQELQAHSEAPGDLVSQNGLQYREGFDRYSDEAILIPEWNDVKLSLSLKTAEKTWKELMQVDGVWPLGESKALSLNCDIGEQSSIRDTVRVTVRSSDGSEQVVKQNSQYHAYATEVRKSGRTWDRKEPEKSGYDEYAIILENTGEESAAVPVYFDVYDVASITGLSAMLCDANGVPTGIPVQTSKNWHDPNYGQYARCFALIPAYLGQSEYRLRIVYGFYGTLPAASHAQLSLIGWGNHGRWDQLAIGTWGETICFDTDMSCVDVAVTDVRMLMSRNGADGQAWGWTDAGWGGDWLGVFNAAGKKLATTEMKAAYFAQGPCLTDVRFNGHYGAAREVEIQSETSTLRTDDFARTFFALKYEFNSSLPADSAWFFKLGRNHDSVSPKLAYGNAEGLLEEYDVPHGMDEGQTVLDRVPIEGEGPWWVGFPGGYLNQDRDWGTGSRGLIIRSYKATLGGVEYDQPSVSTPVFKKVAEGGGNLDLLLTAPSDVSEFQPGDVIEMELELMTFHRTAGDYYGPNEVYRQHLKKNPRSWKTIYREAAGNNLSVQVTGGELRSNYPIVIEATAPEIAVSIEGGRGQVPMRFDGLQEAHGYTLFQIVGGELVQLDQAVNGNDFWQTDYESESGSYRITYNLPLDEGGHSRWVLKKL